MEVRSARVARENFVSGGHRGLPTEALPVAMIALDRGVVQWIDDFLVRREVGSQHGDVLGLGFAPRAVREAFLLQYDHHLADVLQQRDRAGRGRRFAASEHFLALPPAGRTPAAAINPLDFTQAFFPPSVDVELSIVPQDELTSLLEAMPAYCGICGGAISPIRTRSLASARRSPEMNSRSSGTSWHA